MSTARLLLLLLSWLAAGHALAQTDALPTPEPEPPSYSRKGADTCLRCHDESSPHPILAIFRTPHGVRSDKRSPTSGLQCEACHGPGGDHTARLRPGEDRVPMPNFGPHSTAALGAQNQACLNCHQGDVRTHWAGSEHEGADLTCASCHQIHTQRDPVLSPESRFDVCTTCHAQQRAESLLPSGHPLRSGEMNCSHCHSPHGATEPALLRGHTPNEVCMGCHADKRGPFLWEHAPASEECTLCHRPHGSIHPALLTQRPPLLCQQCHSQDGHPGVAYTPQSAASTMVSLRSCGNCHSQVHGSNHPSGAALLR